MKTYNYAFKNNKFTSEIYYKIFADEENILIQIFCGENKTTLEYLSKIFSEMIPQAICIGTTTDGEIKDEKISTLQSVISISVFKETSICAHLIEGYDCFNNGYKIAQKVITRELQRYVCKDSRCGHLSYDHIKNQDTCIIIDCSCTKFVK